MAEYIRKYPDAPSEEEIKTGYAPSTIKAGPFAKFLFWTFAGLAITYAIAYGAYIAIDKVQTMEDERYRRTAARREEPFTGPRLQPSPGHPTLDFQDQAELDGIYREQLLAMNLWEPDPTNLTPGRPAITKEVVGRARAAIGGWAAGGKAANTGGNTGNNANGNAGGSNNRNAKDNKTPDGDTDND